MFFLSFILLILDFLLVPLFVYTYFLHSSYFSPYLYIHALSFCFYFLFISNVIKVFLLTVQILICISCHLKFNNYYDFSFFFPSSQIISYNLIIFIFILSYILFLNFFFLVLLVFCFFQLLFCQYCQVLNFVIIIDKTFRIIIIYQFFFLLSMSN